VGRSRGVRKDDVEEKGEEKKNKVLFFSFCFFFFYAESSIPSVTVPASCTLTESRNYSLIGMKELVRASSEGAVTRLRLYY
jgi:hypothetical protein